MSRARILAVDDQRYFRELIEGLLTDEGYAVETADSAGSALHRLEAADFDVVISDLVMPGVDGVEFVRRIRERRPDQSVVVVTGVVDVKSAVEAMKEGATDYILKPFDRQALLDALDKILSRRQLHDEHARLMAENLEYMGVLSLFERATGLFSTLAVEPLAERLLEGLCLETGAQAAVAWVAADPGRQLLELVGAHGLVRVEGEPESIQLAEAEASWCPGLAEARSVVAAADDAGGPGESLFLPLRADGLTLGVVRLSDRLDGGSFETTDRAAAEKFVEFGGVAMRNAMRFRALERRSLRDPDTRAYSHAYFDDALRNEIQKAHRFGHRLSVLRIAIEAEAASRVMPIDGADIALDDRNQVEAARRIEGTLRATDLLATAEDGAFLVLLPQTDALGAGVLAQRVRAAFDALWEGRAAPAVQFATTTYPVDGTRFETLMEVLERRVERTRESLVVAHPELLMAAATDPMLDRLVALGSDAPAAIEGQILRFVLEDIARRPADRGVLFVSPGLRWLPDVLDSLHEIRAQAVRTEIVVLAEGEAREPHPQVTWVSKSALDSRRAFVVYFGDGPAYAMVGRQAPASDEVRVFQTADRPLVELLAFALQRELGIVLSV